MGLITYLEPDALAIEKDWVDYWRVHNGKEFVHGFKTKEKAIRFGKENGGIAVAKCTLHRGTYVYTNRVFL